MPKKSSENKEKIFTSETGDEHGGEPDHQVVGECFPGSVLRRHRMPDLVGDVDPAERTGSLAGHQPAVDAVPVENVPARQPPGGLAGADPRQADAALVRRAAAVALAGLRRLRPCLDAQHLGNVGEEVAHGWYLAMQVL
ncbi:unnamed protein product [Urochloa decumbens]|uniref:Uncharacterized protein n=1 Tax=Urochloa decumbens TaxID=240449 RepID=A0ABC9CE66_9POAL